MDRRNIGKIINLTEILNMVKIIIKIIIFDKMVKIILDCPHRNFEDGQD